MAFYSLWRWNHFIFALNCPSDCTRLIDVLLFFGFSFAKGMECRQIIFISWMHSSTNYCYCWFNKFAETRWLVWILPTQNTDNILSLFELHYFIFLWWICYLNLGNTFSIWTRIQTDANCKAFPSLCGHQVGVHVGFSDTPCA